MIKLKHIFFLFLIGTTISSCKKEIVEIPPSNEPIFTVTGMIGEDAVSFIVGDDNSTFSTSIEKLNGVDFYSGKISNSETEIEMGIFRGDNDFSQINLDSIISLENIDLASLENVAIFDVKKSHFDNYANIKEIKWFVDGEYSGTNSIKIVNPGKYNVCAHITFNNLTYKEICNEIIVGFKRNTTFNLDYSIQGGNQLSSWIEPSQTAISSVNWYLDDVLISTDTEISTTLPNELKTLKAEITFANGSKRTRSILVDGTGNNMSIQDFAQYENVSNLAWDYNLKLTINHLGEEYTSLFAENKGNKLLVNSIEFYGFDAKNDPVYIVKGTLISKVKSKATNEILDVNLNVSWGLSIK